MTLLMSVLYQQALVIITVLFLNEEQPKCARRSALNASKGGNGRFLLGSQSLYPYIKPWSESRLKLGLGL